MVEATQILAFWFGDQGLDSHPSELQRKHWFSAAPELDSEIRSRFGKITAEAIAGKLSHWRQSLQGELALILLCDQFARNIHRGNRHAFKGDSLALDITESILERGDERNFGLFQQIFVGMPLEHSESLSAQRRSVAYFGKLQQQYGSDESVAPYLAAYCRYALAHQVVIEQFGRYPHRNSALGRESTEDERYWLAQGGGFK